MLQFPCGENVCLVWFFSYLVLYYCLTARAYQPLWATCWRPMNNIIFLFLKSKSIFRSVAQLEWCFMVSRDKELVLFSSEWNWRPMNNIIFLFLKSKSIFRCVAQLEWCFMVSRDKELVWFSSEWNFYCDISISKTGERALVPEKVTLMSGDRT